MIWAKSFLAREGDDPRPPRVGPRRVRSARALFDSHASAGCLLAMCYRLGPHGYWWIAGRIRRVALCQARARVSGRYLRSVERMMESVHGHEGTVNQVIGDGIMASFGALLAREHHAVRACYAPCRCPVKMSC
jgi:hypothetical protein